MPREDGTSHHCWDCALCDHGRTALTGAISFCLLLESTYAAFGEGRPRSHIHPPTAISPRTTEHDRNRCRIPSRSASVPLSRRPRICASEIIDMNVLLTRPTMS